jgi:AcrR family transcriptional regulator
MVSWPTSFRGSSDATSIDDVADGAGVAKGAVYHHFESKEEIFARVFEQMTAALASEVVAAGAAGTSILTASSGARSSISPRSPEIGSARSS